MPLEKSADEGWMFMSTSPNAVVQAVRYALHPLNRCAKSSNQGR